MKEELATIEKEIVNLEKIVKYARKRKIQVYYKNYPSLKENFLNSLLGIKEGLIKLGAKLSGEPSTDLTKDFIYLVDELRINIEKVDTSIIEGYIREMKNILSELRALAELQRLQYTPELELGIDLELIPFEIRTDIAADIDEIKKCYSSGAYRAAIVFCGRMLEIALARKYFEKTHVDPIKQKWTLGRLINESKKKIGIFQPGLDSLCETINKVRIPSIHRVREGIYLPTPQDVVGVFHLVQSVLQKLWEPKPKKNVCFLFSPPR
jgi:hypothetical protein